MPGVASDPGAIAVVDEATSAPDDDLVRYASRALGSALRLTVRIPSGGTAATAPPLGERGWAAVVDEFAAVDIALSRFRDDSELTTLNRLAGSGRSIRVSRRLRHALAVTDRARRETDGRFDVRVLGALERIGEHGATLDAARPPCPANAGIGRLVHAPGVAIDLGGIGKGLALRWSAALVSGTIPVDGGFLLEAGGDIVVGGMPPRGGWLIGVEDPIGLENGEAGPLAVAAIDHGALATSSVRVRRWIGPDGTPVHHLLDPRTGEPARTGLISVSVAGPDPAWAEVWTKALFLAGRDGIASEARARGMAAWWVDDRGRLGMTPAARVSSAWVEESRLG